MNTFKNPPKEDWNRLLERPTRTYQEIEGLVAGIFSEISAKGDEAVRKYSKKFDQVELNDLSVKSEELVRAEQELGEDLKNAIRLAKSNIERFHQAQKTAPVCVETSPGVQCWQEKRPIQKVGLYIPGGTAPLFSTILMLAVPASLAGCEEIILCTPSNSEGKVDPAILFTARICGIKKVYKIGGIQAIASMCFGTETVPKVYKLFGPGNQYVTVAKQMALKHGVAIDLPAGPSELLVMADESAKASYIASDLLSQAEHGEDSQVILVTLSEGLIEEVMQELEKQVQVLPRKEIALKALANSKAIFMDSESMAMDLVNAYAPEHLIICLKNADNILPRVINAGSVFVGNYTPESAGDYASGTNHTLPTNGFAKNFSGVNLDSFYKAVTFQKISPEGLQGIGSSIELMAQAEGLIAHKNAVSLRLNDLKNKTE